jgi:hypothetical protein
MFSPVGAEKSDWLSLGPTNKFCLDGSAIRSLFDFQGAAKPLRSLGHQKPGPKSRALLTGVNAPIAALH